MMSLKIKLTSLFLLLIYAVMSQNSAPFQLTDLHIHLKGGFTADDAAKKSENEKINYGIAVNGGLGFTVQNDRQLDSFLLQMQPYPQFYIGMQAEGREWVKLFSNKALDKFDYIFTDAMTFTDRKGRRNRIWIPEETWVDDDQQFMDDLVNLIVEIMKNEPIDIYVNPTYLPECISARYDELWTEQRMLRIIEAAKANHIAIEINNRFKIPSERFVKMAKQNEIKFTIGTNNVDANFSGASYAIEIIKKCGLSQADFFHPVK